LNRLCFSFLLLVFTAQAQALVVKPGDARDWSFHDLTKETAISAFLGGAEASLTHTVGKAQIPDASVYIYKSSEKVKETMGSDQKLWEKMVIGPSQPGRMVHSQKTFQVGKEWRYYVEMQADSTAGNQLYTSLMAIQRDGYILIFSFQDGKEVYFKGLPQVKELFRSLTLQ
jgi:hypothetical protein